MTRIYVDEEPTDEMIGMSNEYGDHVLVEDVFECDICGADWPISQRWHVLAPRASGEMTEVMWVCGDCGPTAGTKHGEDCDHE